MNKCFKLIHDSQENWAKQKHLKLKYVEEEAYTLSLAPNLYYPTLSTSTIDEYLAGKGNEFKGHMKALCSSSALVVNVFEYWKQKGRVSDILQVFGEYSDEKEMFFEKTHAILRWGTPPHLDIEFCGGSKRPLAIESKFAEPYRSKTTQRNDTNLKQYLDENDIWRGLAKLKNLARDVHQEEKTKTSWPYLDVPQLIKHILGLTKAYKPKGFTLLYLWFDCKTEESSGHRADIKKFNDKIKGEVHFKSLSYQELFNKIQAIPNVDPNYTKYLKERYFKLR
jgi:hypothetical protein